MLRLGCRFVDLSNAEPLDQSSSSLQLSTKKSTDKTPQPSNEKKKQGTCRKKKEEKKNTIDYSLSRRNIHLSRQSVTLTPSLHF
jgi:hypothetical protein